MLMISCIHFLEGVCTVSVCLLMTETIVLQKQLYKSRQNNSHLLDVDSSCTEKPNSFHDEDLEQVA